MHRVVLDASRDVGLRGDGVVVTCEDDQRRIGAALRDEQERLVARVVRGELRRHQFEQVCSDPLFMSTLGRDVDELESPVGETVGEPGHEQSLSRDLEMLDREFTAGRMAARQFPVEHLAA